MALPLPASATRSAQRRVRARAACSYVPRGWVHAVVNPDGAEASTHLTLSLHVAPWQTAEGLLHRGLARLADTVGGATTVVTGLTPPQSVRKPKTTHGQ